MGQFRKGLENPFSRRFHKEAYKDRRPLRQSIHTRLTIAFLTAYAVASSPGALLLASIWWPVGLVLALIYFVFISRRYAGKVSVKRDTAGFY